MILVLQIIGAATGILIIIVMDSPPVVRFMYGKLKGIFMKLAGKSFFYRTRLRVLPFEFVMIYGFLNILCLAFIVICIKGPP